MDVTLRSSKFTRKVIEFLIESVFPAVPEKGFGGTPTHITLVCCLRSSCVPPSSGFHEVWRPKVIGRDVGVREATCGSVQSLPPKNWGKNPSPSQTPPRENGTAPQRVVIVVVVVVVVVVE